jgi:hypothetical protein
MTKTLETMARALFEREHARFRRLNPRWAKGHKDTGIVGCKPKPWSDLTEGQKDSFVERVRP